MRSGSQFCLGRLAEPPVEPAVDAGVVTPADAGVVRCGTAGPSSRRGWSS